MNNVFLSNNTIIALLSALGGLLAGGGAMWGAFKHGRSEESSTLIDEAMKIVISLREEVSRLETKSLRLEARLGQQERRIADLERENEELRGIISGQTKAVNKGASTNKGGQK